MSLVRDPVRLGRVSNTGHVPQADRSPGRVANCRYPNARSGRCTAQRAAAHEPHGLWLLCDRSRRARPPRPDLRLVGFLEPMDRFEWVRETAAVSTGGGYQDASASATGYLYQLSWALADLLQRGQIRPD